MGKNLENAEFVSVNPQNLLGHTDFKNAYFYEKYYKSLLFLSVTNVIYNEIHKILAFVPKFLLDKFFYFFIYFFSIMRNLLVHCQSLAR